MFLPPQTGHQTMGLFSEIDEEKCDKLIDKLETVARIAVEYVGSANYQERENHAISEIERCFRAAKLGKENEIVFRELRE